MVDSCTFAADVVQTIGDRLIAKREELGLLVGSNSSLKEWIACEAFIACKQRQASYPFCEVAARPTYASENVTDESANQSFGDLRVGGPDEGAHHCWAFIEIAILDDANHAKEEASRDLKAAAERLKRLGWKKSAALLIVVAISEGDVMKRWADTLSTIEVWSQLALTRPLVMELPNNGSAILKAFDIKRDPNDILSTLGRD